ncbi:MAG: hypothetical protein NZX77_22765, partial [Polyangiaceae bacterium]|nr:hypothetical protein [Polyangiaceae bacterium]
TPFAPLRVLATVRLLLVILLLSPLVRAAPRWYWRQLQPTTSPPPSLGHRMAHDPVRQRTVLVTGVQCCPADLKNDVWEWDGSTWIQIPAVLPGLARWMGSVAFDPSTKKLIYFGGKSYLDTLPSGTWTWDGSQWTQLPGGAEDPANRWRAAALGATGDLGVLLLMGAQQQGFLQVKTMSTLQGGTWKSLAVVPPARIDQAAAWSSSTGQALAFGGRSCANDVASCAAWEELATWKSGEPSWTTLPGVPNGPQARWGATLVVHEKEKKAILVGGQDAGGLIEDGEQPGETATWSLDLSSLTWEKIPGVSLPARVYAAAVWDDARKQVFLVGGARWTKNSLNFSDLSQIPPEQLLGDTWVLDRLGVPCNADQDCSTGHCVDGVCCEQTCGECRRCDAPGEEGSCVPVTSAEDPDSCSGLCSKEGVCQPFDQPPGAFCDDPKVCQSGHCVDGVCCVTEACGVCERCIPQGGVCDLVVGAPDPDSCPTSCSEDGVCQGNERDTGESCSKKGECKSGFCVDGVCCEQPCDAPCQTCSADQGAPSNGICAPRLCPDPFQRCDPQQNACLDGQIPLFEPCKENKHC